MNSWEEGGVREDSPVLLATAAQSLRTSYATGKLLTEYFLLDRVERGCITGCSIRFANVYSPTEAHDEHIIPHIISSLQKTGTVTLLEHAKETKRTFLHNSDSCDAVLALIANGSALDGSIYNVGTTEEISIVGLVHKIARLLDMPDVVIDFTGTRSADPRRRLLNLERIRERTGWSPKVGLDEGLRQCIEFRTKGIQS
jgi:dTDP-glucose 4,6-dehydratase